MKKSNLLFILVLNTLALHIYANEELLSDLDNPTKILHQSIEGACSDCSPNNQNSLIAEEINLKDHHDPSCNLRLGWGHTNQAKDNISAWSKLRQCAGGIGMGCNTGDPVVGIVTPEYAKFQRGSNGTYRNYDFQGTQNGGLNPVILEQGASQKLLNHNSYIGFMRLTQYHWLQLVNFSHDHLLNKTCSSVKIKFTCHAGDLNNEELNKRLNAYQNKNTFFDKVIDIKKFKQEIDILKRFEPLDKCFSDQTLTSTPKNCEDSIIITTQTEMKKHCREWVQDIQGIKQQNWNTPGQLNKNQQPQYPPIDTLH